MNYGAINAKLKAMKGRLLSFEEYAGLCGARKVAELGMALKSSPVYKECLRAVPEGDIHRESIEERIVLSLINDFSNIYSFITDYPTRRFLDCYFLRNEIRLLKMILCMLYDDRDITYFLPYLRESAKGRALRIDAGRLVNAKSLPEFIDMLQGTEFHSVLANVYKEKTTLFQMEVQLDLFYYFILWKANRQYLGRLDGKLVTHLTGTEIDMRNIMWIYRFKTFYNVANSLIYTYLIPHHYKLNKGAISRMVEAQDSKELETEIKACVYGRVLYGEKDIDTAFYEELSLRYRRAIIRNPNSLAETLGYIFFKELEIKNLITIMEGIRYSLMPDEILEKIICVKQNNWKSGAG